VPIPKRRPQGCALSLVPHMSRTRSSPRRPSPPQLRTVPPSPHPQPANGPSSSRRARRTRLPPHRHAHGFRTLQAPTVAANATTSSSTPANGGTDTPLHPVGRVQVKCSAQLLNGLYRVSAHRRSGGCALPYHAPAKSTSSPNGCPEPLGHFPFPGCPKPRPVIQVTDIRPSSM
jgi:hypothetical protein